MTHDRQPADIHGGTEIERKFLVIGDDSYKAMAVKHYRIRQGYFAVKGATVRVRQRDDEAFLTIKGPARDAERMSRYEYEVALAPADAEELFQLCQPPHIEKTRYLVPVGNHLFEVDEFHGDNDGLVIAEVELHSVDETFERPPFLGKEVTGQRQYHNAALRQYPYKMWHTQQPTPDTHD